MGKLMVVVGCRHVGDRSELVVIPGGGKSDEVETLGTPDDRLDGVTHSDFLVSMTNFRTSANVALANDHSSSGPVPSSWKSSSSGYTPP